MVCIGGNCTLITILLGINVKKAWSWTMAWCRTGKNNELGCFILHQLNSRICFCVQPHENVREGSVVVLECMYIKFFRSNFQHKSHLVGKQSRYTRSVYISCIYNYYATWWVLWNTHIVLNIFAYSTHTCHRNITPVKVVWMLWWRFLLHFRLIYWGNIFVDRFYMVYNRCFDIPMNHYWGLRSLQALCVCQKQS